MSDLCIAHTDIIIAVQHLRTLITLVFTNAEARKLLSDFGLIGRLPYAVNTLDEQCERAYQQYLGHESAIRKNSFLTSLKVRPTHVSTSGAA